MKRLVTLSLILCCISATLHSGTTGKIAGVVKDARSNEPLVGVNVVIEGTTLGSVTGIDGDFAILNVAPGSYRVKASMLGYASSVQTNVQVELDQTTTLAMMMKEEAILGEEVVVVAQKPVIQKDVASSVANISTKEIENLPVASVSGVVGLQAGIQGGLVIRG